MVVLLTMVPQTFEANIVALISYKLFAIPIAACYCIAYVVSCISPSVMVPGIMALGD